MSKTPIVYYGGKQRLLGTILELIPEHEIFCEPFVGGGAVFIAKDRVRTEIINDIDAMISVFYRVLRDNFTELREKIDRTLYDRSTHTVAKCIRKVPHLFSDLQIAWAFFVLSSLGFSGTLDSFGCYTKGTKAHTHENRKTLFNEELHKRFEGVQIENTDALDVIKRRDTPKTFFYLDPPYIETAQSHYRGYTRDDYRDLLELLTKLKGKFLLSSFPNDLLDLFTKEFGWHRIEVNQTKPASRNPDGTKKQKTEVLTANYPIEIPAE